MILRHKKGRGRLCDDAECNSAVYLSVDSVAAQSAKLRDCRLEDSRADGNCQIYGGMITASHITGRTIVAGNPNIVHSFVICSEVSGHPTIIDAHLTGTTEVCDSPFLRGKPGEPLTLKDAVVYGSPTVEGCFTVTGRVHEGRWTRAPGYKKLPWCDVTECVDGKVLLDCRCRSIEYWFNHGPKLAARWGWSDEMIKETLDVIESFKPRPLAIGRPEQVAHKFETLVSVQGV